MEAISGRKRLQEIAADGAERPIQVSPWMMLLLEGANELLTLIKNFQAIELCIGLGGNDFLG